MHNDTREARISKPRILPGRNRGLLRAGSAAVIVVGFFLGVSRLVPDHCGSRGEKKSLWAGMCFGQVFVILMSQLTCYYYSGVLLAAFTPRGTREPLRHRLSKRIEQHRR